MSVMKVALAGDALGNYIFGLDPQLLIDSLITMIAMFALFLLLSYLLFVPARNLLQKRQDGIREQMETAAKEKSDAIAFKAEYESKLKNVDKEAEPPLLYSPFPAPAIPPRRPSASPGAGYPCIY